MNNMTRGKLQTKLKLILHLINQRIYPLSGEKSLKLLFGIIQLIGLIRPKLDF